MTQPRIIGVAGSTGFMGQALSKLAASEDVRVVPISLRTGMLREELEKQLEALVTQGVTDFIHLAWPGSSSVDYKYSTENEGAGLLTVDTAELCVEMGLRFYGLGSAAENRIPETPYSKSKSDTRKALREQISEGLITWLRPHYVFDESSWPLFVRESTQTGGVVIRDDSPKDFIHINDVSRGAVASIKSGLVGEVDIASGKLTRPSELLSALGLGFSILQGRHEVQHEVGTVDISKLLNVSWYPNLTLEILKEKHGKQ